MKIRVWLHANIKDTGEFVHPRNMNSANFVTLKKYNSHKIYLPKSKFLLHVGYEAEYLGVSRFSNATPLVRVLQNRIENIPACNNQHVWKRGELSSNHWKVYFSKGKMCSSDNVIILLMHAWIVRIKGSQSQEIYKKMKPVQIAQVSNFRKVPVNVTAK